MPAFSAMTVDQKGLFSAALSCGPVIDFVPPPGGRPTATRPPRVVGIGPRTPSTMATPHGICSALYFS